MRRYANASTFVWQRPDWPHFYWDAEALLAPLSELSKLHGILLGRMSALGLCQKNSASLASLAEELLGSSEIEGVVLRADSVRSSIARRLGIGDDGLLVEDHYVEGLVDVMMDAVTNCEAPLTAERLFGWHCALFPMGRSGMVRITVGDWRVGDEPMQVVSGAMGHEKVHYQAPPSASVAMEMGRLLEWCNNAEETPVVMAAVAHLWFVTIHPFDDGNGRISRTLADYFLSRFDAGAGRFYSMSAEINRNKKSYYEILELTQKGNLDITEWLLWFFETLSSAFCRALAQTERTLQKAAYWDRFGDCEVNERQRKVINRMWDGFEGKLTTSKWAKMCHCSQDTALRDIKDLMEKGMLEVSADGGRSTWYRLTS